MILSPVVGHSGNNMNTESNDVKNVIKKKTRRTDNPERGGSKQPDVENCCCSQECLLVVSARYQYGNNTPPLLNYWTIELLKYWNIELLNYSLTELPLKGSLLLLDNGCFSTITVVDAHQSPLMDIDGSHKRSGDKEREIRSMLMWKIRLTTCIYRYWIYYHQNHHATEEAS